MSKHILRCSKCNKYTMKEVCDCGEKTLNPNPARFSIEDKYAKYRRKAKEKLKGGLV